MSKNATQRKNITVTYAITAVPARRKLVTKMLEQIGDNIDVQIMWDIEKKGNWYNAKRAWMRKPLCASHHAVLQDDLLLCADFTATVDKIVSLLPNKVISLYTHRATAVDVDKAGKRWIVRNSASAQAILMPSDLILKFLLFDETYNEQNWRRSHTTIAGDDLRLRIFMLANDKLFWFPVPSLVQHTDVKSTFGYPSGRNSHVFRGVETSLLSLDWTKGVNEPVYMTGPGYDNVKRMFKGEIIYE